MGRRPKLTPEQQAAVREILEKRILTVRQLAEMYKVGKVTIQQYLPDVRKYGRRRPQSDLTGKVFEKWTVLRRVPRPERLITEGPYYLCRCACGNQRVLLGWNLRTGRTSQCSSCAARKRMASTKERQGECST